MLNDYSKKNLKDHFVDSQTANFYEMILQDFVNYKRHKASPVNLLSWKYSLLEKLEDFMDDTIDIVIKQCK